MTTTLSYVHTYVSSILISQRYLKVSDFTSIVLPSGDYQALD